MWDYLLGGLSAAGTSIDPIWGGSLIGDISNVLGSKQGLQGLQTGMAGMNLYNQNKFNDQAMNIMNDQMNMQKTAYQQDMENQQKTQNLNF